MRRWAARLPTLRRRQVLAAVPALLLGQDVHALPERTMRFPADHGAHPELRTEWWYITGHAEAAGRGFGFQVTFFRSRVDPTQRMQSRFAAKQLVFAHAAVSDVQGGKLWHDDRIAREGFGIAQAQTGDARLRLHDWSLVRQGEAWHAVLPATGFALDLRCAPTQPPVLQGRAGLSRKGPEAIHASYYYSIPQLAVSGRLALQGRAFEVTGRAWMDHEWSEEYLHRDAVGWDWTGMNFDDGGALTAFRIRRRDGTTLWDGGSYRNPKGELVIARPGEIVFEPKRRWTSPASNASYPVEWTLRSPAGVHTIRAVIDNQELDSRQSTGAIYWEGLSDLLDPDGTRVGRGYLEMTGYAEKLRM